MRGTINSIEKSNIERLLNKLISRIPSSLAEKLVLVGSVNLFLQGVEVTPKKDIDFATDYNTVNALKPIFSDKLVRTCFEHNGDTLLPFSYLFITYHDFEIEFFDAITYGESFYKGMTTNENIRLLSENGIRVLDLKAELIVYKKTGKTDKIIAIEKKLQNI